MCEGVDRQGTSGDDQQLPGQVPYFLADVVQPGYQRGGENHAHADNDVNHFGQEDQLPVHVPGLFHLARAQALSHHDGYGAAHAHHDDAEQVPGGAVDVQRCHGVQSAGGVELGDKGHTQGPENLVDQQGRRRAKDLHGQGTRHIQALVSARKERIFICMPVGVTGYDQQFHIPGDDRRDGSALYAHGWSAQMTEDQDPVAEQVGQDGTDSGKHRRPGFAGFPQRTGVNLDQREGRQPPQHDVQVVAAAALRQGQVAAVAFTFQEGSNKAFPEKQVDQDGRGADQHAEVHLAPESIAHTVRVALAEELGAVDTGAAHAAEHGQDEHQHHLVRDGCGGNGFRAETSDHDVVQQGHKGSDKLLDHDGNQQGDDAFIEGLVADKTRKHKYLNS